MPMSEAAMSGISANGLRWKFNISFSTLTAKVGEWEEGVTPTGEIEKIRNAIVERVKVFLHHRSMGEDMRYDIEDAVEQLEMVDPEVEEIRFALNRLYDQFDYHRVCVIR